MKELLVKRIRSKLYEWRNIIGMVVWDVVLGAALVFFLYVALLNVSNTSLRIALMAFTVAIIAISIVVKYVLFYQKAGVDDVTGGKNKREFERISRILLQRNGEFALVYANIDRFKLVNELYGDEEGDRVLREVHKVIDNELLSWDEVSGRIMADNFGMLVRFHSMNKLEHRLNRLNEQLGHLCDEQGVAYGLRLFFGVYLVTNKEMPVSAMLERANLALKKTLQLPQQLKKIGIYDEKEHKKLEREKHLEMRMEQALQNGEFVPYLQPKYELTHETIAGAEALVRWVSPEEGMILPGEFIPLFEKNGFIVELDLYMFEQVCKMIESWHKNGYRIIPVSVNMSREHFLVPNFFDSYREILERYDVPKGSIEIELTESLFFNEISMMTDLVNKIHEAGMRCSIDDFGSGYSSLNMLKDIKVDALKLDRVFFVKTEEDKRGKDVINSILHLAQNLQLQTISEGVEIRSQVEYLKEMDCDYIQGYVFAKPMPVNDFVRIAFQKSA